MPIQMLADRWRPHALSAGAAILVTSALTLSAAAVAQEPTPAASPVAGATDCAPATGDPAELSEAKLYIEYNATEGDLGVQGLFDSDGLTELCVFDPSGTQILAVAPQAQLHDLGMGPIFFESREPPLSEFDFSDLAATFPEGEYEVRGTFVDGQRFTGTATFTHDVPAPPTILAPQLAEDEESAREAVVSPEDLVIEWAHVTETVDGGEVTITGYEVIVTNVEAEDPHGMSQPIYDVNVPPDVNALPVPVEFLEPDTVYEVEVLALEESGNQTISLAFFATE